jgi:peptide-methionine (R)-S-oxide reductase
LTGPAFSVPLRRTRPSGDRADLTSRAARAGVASGRPSASGVKPWALSLRPNAERGSVKGSLFQARGIIMAVKPESAFEVERTEAEWEQRLTPKQFGVLRRHGTEYAGSSPLLREHRDGTFSCAGCGQALFASNAKYESGSGWPSFYAAIENAVGTTVDSSLGMERVEIYCRRCGGHLGHVFPDGPQPTGQRYCTNGVALRFTPSD